MNFWKRYPGDYVRDTGHLSLAEHGAYTVMLDHTYSTRKPLPSSLEALYRLCRATSIQERRAVQAVAEEFFPIADDGLRHNKRADMEIARWEAKAETNREVGKRGGRPRKASSDNPPGNPNGIPQETQTVSQREPTGNPLQKPEARSQNIYTEVPQAAAPESEKLSGIALVKTAYPKTSNRVDWLMADRLCQQRIEYNGETWASLEGRAKAYAEYCATGGASEPKYIMAPQNFFADDERNGPWRTEYKSQPTKEQIAREQAMHAEADRLRGLKESRALIGLTDFRDPHPGETAKQYDTALRMERNNRGLVPQGEPRFATPANNLIANLVHGKTLR